MLMQHKIKISNKTKMKSRKMEIRLKMDGDKLRGENEDEGGNEKKKGEEIRMKKKRRWWWWREELMRSSQLID
jgi:hypothetical protein